MCKYVCLWFRCMFLFLILKVPAQTHIPLSFISVRLRQGAELRFRFSLWAGGLGVWLVGWWVGLQNDSPTPESIVVRCLQYVGMIYPGTICAL